MSKSHTTGERDVKAHITSEKEVTVDFVVNQANEIWKLVKKRKGKNNKNSITACESDEEELMEDMRKLYPEFCRSYPIVLRYMCQMNEYNSKTFRLYLGKIKAHPYTTQEEYLDSQTDYIVMLYKSTHPRWNATDVSRLRVNIRNMLQQEHDTMKKYAEEFEKQVDAETAKLANMSLDELKEFAEKIGVDGMALAGSTRVETDLHFGDTVDVDSMVANVAAEKIFSTNAADLLL